MSPDQFTQIPVPAKILSLLLHELMNEIESGNGNGIGVESKLGRGLNDVKGLMNGGLSWEGVGFQGAGVGEEEEEEWEDLDEPSDEYEEDEDLKFGMTNEPESFHSGVEEEEEETGVFAGINQILLKVTFIVSLLLISIPSILFLRI